MTEGNGELKLDLPVVIQPPPDHGNGHSAHYDPPMMTLRSAEQIAEIRAASIMLDRMMFMTQAGISFKGARDLYETLGYPRLITNRMYRERYQRGGIAGRVVDALPNAGWRGEVEIIENKDPKVDTPFEKAWYSLDARLQITTAKLPRVDKLAGLSTYAVLLLGAPGDLSSELPKGRPPQDSDENTANATVGDSSKSSAQNTDKSATYDPSIPSSITSQAGATTPGSLLYLTPFSGGGGPGGYEASRAMAIDSDCTIESFDVDTASPRFGLPLFYRLKRTDLSSPMLARQVHWTRIIHIAENCLYDEVYGQPALERVYNLLDDLDKVTGGGAEAFWLRANAGLHMNIDKDMALPEDNEKAKEQMKKLDAQSEDYKHQLTRWIRTRGVEVQTLGSEVANFQSPADAILTQIAGAKSMPKRILTGSEMGELASSQDRDNWKDQINGRQLSYMGPYIIRPLIDRLIAYNYLPTPEKGPMAYEVKWPHVQTLTEQEKADGAAKWANVNKVFGETVFTDAEIRDHWYQMEPVEDEITDEYKGTGAIKMATVNKTQGVTVFTSAEIRKTWYGWDPLTPDEEVPIGAPEKVVVSEAPPVSGDPHAEAEEKAAFVPSKQAQSLVPANGKTGVAAPAKAGAATPTPSGAAVAPHKVLAPPARGTAAVPTPAMVNAEAALESRADVAEMLKVLEQAILCGATEVIDEIIGVRHAEQFLEARSVEPQHITINQPQQESPVVIVNPQPRHTTSKRIEYDDEGRAIRIIEE